LLTRVKKDQAVRMKLIALLKQHNVELGSKEFKLAAR